MLARSYNALRSSSRRVVRLFAHDQADHIDLKTLAYEGGVEKLTQHRVGQAPYVCMTVTPL